MTHNRRRAWRCNQFW